MDINQLIGQVQHIQFCSLAAGVAFWRQHGGHLYVGDDESCIVWFSASWTASAIFASQIVRGVSGVLNPTEDRLSSLLGMPNPYEPGTVKHNLFAVHYASAMQLSPQCLVERYLKLKKDLRTLEKDRSPYASTVGVEVEVIDRVYRYRFERSIQDHVFSLLEQELAA